MAKMTSALRKSFEKAAASDFNFYKAVREAYDLFPQMQRTIFFVDVNTANIIHPDAAIRAEIVTAINNHPEFRKDLAEDCANLRNDRLSACKPLENGNGAIFFVLLYLEKDMRTTFDGKKRLRQNQHFAFDHEFAHALIEAARGSSVKCESIADSYAALRHFQRYGTNTGLVEAQMQRRAALAFVNNDADHFTAPALESVLEVKNDFDFSQLTPEQTAAMANYIGCQSPPRGNDKKALTRSFNKLEGLLDDVKDDTPLKKLANYALTVRAPAVAKWSKVALSAFLDRKIKLRVDPEGPALPLKSRYWQDVRAAMRKPA